MLQVQEVGLAAGMVGLKIWLAGKFVLLADILDHFIQSRVLMCDYCHHSSCTHSHDFVGFDVNVV